MFLQAAGMPPRLTRLLERQPTRAPLGWRLHTLVALAAHVTERPWEVKTPEVDEAVRAAGSRAAYLDTVGVIVGFNFVTRVANALDVEPEISPWIRRTESLRQLALKGMSLLLRCLVDLRPRRTTRRAPDENALALLDLMGDLHVEVPADFLGRLSTAPHLLESQRELLEALLKRGDPSGRVGLDPGLFLAVGHVVLGETGPRDLRHRVAAALRHYNQDYPSELMDFVRDVTRRSHGLTEERVDGLRAHHLRDEDILDLVSAAALWNAFARLDVLLMRMSNFAEREQRAAPAAVG
jgi:alkylhydroperoxidase family enzyme